MGGGASVKGIACDDAPPDTMSHRLPNLGNTCYCNVILQCFFVSPTVRAHFRALPTDRELPASSPLAHLLLLFHEGSQPTPTRVCRLDPSGFLRSVRSATERFPAGYQHDAQEFLLFLVDSFDATLRELDLPPFSSVLEGTRCPRFVCSTCSTKTDRLESFSCLPLAMPSDPTDGCDLQSVVDESLSPQPIEDDWVCDCCHEKRPGHVYSYLSRVPQLVVVHLVRFSFDRRTCTMRKNFEPVDIAETLRVNSGNGPATYRIVSVVVHCGASMHAGHFMALIKIGQKWVLASDESLTVITAQQVAGAVTVGMPQKRLVPYMLFYERVKEGQ
jgi:ubiquitin C-terminal hydrolase